MLVEIGTYPTPFVAGRDSADIRRIDLAKPGNGKWLVGHLKWAMQNSRFVMISRIREKSN